VIPGEDAVIDGEVVKTHRTDLKRPWHLVRRLAGLDGVHIHDLRHSHAAVAVASNVSLRLIGGLLGHSSEKTSARYAHLSDDPLRDAAEKVGTRIADALDGKVTPTAEVTALPKRK
jgi:integrase